jgi:hypothetical protein
MARKDVALIFSHVSEREAQQLKHVCRLRGEQISDFVRRSVKIELARLGYLTREELKALGIQRAQEEFPT